LSLVLGMICLRWILRPMLKLRLRAESLAIELTGSKMPADSRCDIAAVIEVLDGLPERLAKRNAELQAVSAKAEAASRAKSQFIANISHEVRTPMNAIIGMSHILSRSIQDPGQRDKLEIIRQAADQLLGLLDNILDLSRLDSERIDLERHPFCLWQLMRHLEALVSRRAAGKGLKLSFDIDDNLLQQILVGDALHLQQALVNLVGNAIKFTKQGSVNVAIRLETEDTSNIRLHFRIADTGIGIPPDIIHEIFRPFEQADASLTRQFGGSGLGLTISQRFVQLMGGTIEVASTPVLAAAFRSHWHLRSLRRQIKA
jgi:signal transduction histidine kinase